MVEYHALESEQSRTPSMWIPGKIEPEGRV